MIQKSHDDRMLWAQFDALEMGTGWEDTDILKPQIMIESVYGDSHPGSYHLNQMVEQAVYGVYQCGRQAGQVLRYRHLRRLRAGSRRHERRSGVPRSHRQHGRGSRLRRALGRHDPLVELRQVHPGAPQGRSPHGHSGHLHAGRLHAPRSEYDDLSGRRATFPCARSARMPSLRRRSATTS